MRPLEPDIQRVFDHAVAAFDTLEVRFDHAGRLYPTYASIQNGEAAQTHAQLFPQRRDEYGADVAARIENALRVTLAEYTEATAERERIRANFQRIFTVADVLLTPGLGRPAGAAGGAGPAGLPRRRAALHGPAGRRGPADLRRARRLRRPPPAGVGPGHGPAAQRGPCAHRRRGAVQRDSIGEGGIFVRPLICGISIPISSRKHQHHSSPGSSERMIGCSLSPRVRARVLVG